jgi:PAS domain-containing protein
LPAYGVHDGAKVVLCSDELAEMFGIASGADVVGRDILTFIAPDARDQAIATVLMGGPGSNELVGIRADGGLFPIGVQSCEIRLR